MPPIAGGPLSTASTNRPWPWSARSQAVRLASAEARAEIPPNLQSQREKVMSPATPCSTRVVPSSV
jgi:hypothetical protein